MLTLESLNLDKSLSVFLATGFAEKALAIWEREYPEDMKPRRAIEAAKEWLKNPSATAARDAADTANAAATAARDTADTANAAATAARDTADTANAAAARAAARATAYAAAATAYAAAANAAYAAANAATALEADKKSLIHKVILENLDFILQYRIENGQSFDKPELIFDYLTEEQKQRFLFNLDAVA